ncbi:MAG: thioredoxin-dependent thiol peroxidase [Cyclobacteriaceae bacterium]|nr:thioredoxin-dependent thiol peroxidase [Cyclobacteriaceae bacterium]MCB0500070.1 thioredoxin-dependent thiol peroxidase [Cyclobacteriaceae bacterium]MCB9239328.1 thioredoxin-dependent thiol peroxidase [Flammeovirgaceae bacterium]MCW5903682.1 thioredoxin-dependent thiol peroxidase [Cyclobacteriaceae bacterium]
MALKVGQKAPDFKVADQDGNQVSLSGFKGKKVILYFYPKDQTPGCTAEACNLRDNYRGLQRKGYEVIGVSTDTEKSHQKFIEKQNLPFRLLADVDKVAHAKYGTWVEKSMYGRKYMGTARVTFIIDEKGAIEKIIEKVDTKNHTEQILSPSGPEGPAKSSRTRKSPPKKKAAKKPSKKAARKKAK